jgi:Raf kinase inhibitor-like YbhB/YbcL family protein
MKNIISSRRFAALALAALMSAPALAFELHSPDIGPDKPFTGRFIFRGMGCEGANLSPTLTWSDPPEGVKSFALMVHDPDAPTGGAGIWHWVVVNIPATARGLDEGSGNADGAGLPEGSRQITNDYAGLLGGKPGWGGPCPPKGAPAHEYVFTLYALNVAKIDLPPAATASNYGFMINRAAIGKAVMKVKYGR